MAFDLKGLGGRASGILSGVAAVTTVVAATFGILSQFGLISSHDTPKSVALTSPPGAPPVSMGAVAPLAAAPAKPQPADLPRVAVAEPRVSPLGAENSRFAHHPTPGAASALASIDRNRPESIAGAWRDQGMGACHLISQTGSKFQVTNYDPVTGEVISQGEGTVDGNHLAIDYPNSRRPVTVDLHISPNGQWLFGKVTRFDGTHRAMWRYLGPACPKPG
jgi:hypothetical protein